MSTAVEKINKDTVFKFLEPKQEELITIVGKGSLEQGKALIMKEMSFAIQAANKNPQLRNANPASVAMAVYNVILSGLTLNPMMEMCDLVPYETGSYDEQGNWRGRVEAQLQPRYGGLLKLAADTGAFKDAPFTSCVYKNDEFEVVLGSERKIVHKPAYDSLDDNDITHVYCIISLANGGSHIEVMPIGKVKEVMKRSQGWKKAEKDKKYNSVWHNFFPQQALKTVLKSALKTVPKSSFDNNALMRLQAAVAADNHDYDLDAPKPLMLNEAQLDKIIETVKIDPNQLDGFVSALTEKNIDPEQIEKIKVAVNPPVAEEPKEQVEEQQEGAVEIDPVVEFEAQQNKVDREEPKEKTITPNTLFDNGNA